MKTDVGRVLKKGRIRVDARKAMAKLREHLLVDLHLYAVEVVRAAVLAGATRIDVAYDADDVEVTFDGAPLPASSLPHLFEHLTGEDGGASHQRLLALAVNAALGLDPAWVSLTTATGGAASRVAWSPALVAAIEREERPLPEPEAIPAPPGMPATGTRFQLRRKVGWETVRRAAGKAAPREVSLLVEAAHCLRVPLFVNGAAVGPSGRSVVLARASISLPGARRAHVEITTGHETAPHVDFCELGLLLCRASFAFGRHFPMAEHHGVRPPVRIVVDSDALPTNASRSAVREDAPLFAALASSAAPALSDAIAAIAFALLARGEAPDGVTVDTSDKAALHDVLGAFLCAAEASLVARVAMPDALRSLLDLPLFQDGLGRPLSHATIPREDPLLVWAGDKPVPAPMEPWAEKIVWRRGRLAERILDGRKAFAHEKLAELAKRGEERHRKLFAMPAGFVSAPDETYLAREAFRFQEGAFAGLSGEVAIAADPAAYVRNLALRVFVQGRFYEAYPLPEDRVPLPCVIALQWPGHIVPRLGYEGIEPTNGTHAALAFAVRQAVFLCDRAAADRARTGPPFDERAAAVLRAALATAVTAPARMYSVEGHEMPALADLQGLVHAAVWPTTEGAFVSLQDVCEYVARTGALCVAAPGMTGRAPDGRPVLAVTTDEIDHLAACLRSGVAIVRYDGALSVRSRDGRTTRRGAELLALIDRRAADARAPVMRLSGKGFTCAVTLGDEGTHIWHAGVRVSRIELAETFGGITIGIDDDSIVPTATWGGILWAADQALAGRAYRMFAERLVHAIQGDERARAELFHSVPLEDDPAARVSVGPPRYVWPEQLTALPPAVSRFLVDRVTRGERLDANDEERALAQQIESIPFLTMIRDGEPAPASLADVRATHKAPSKIPCLPSAPRFRPVRWRPLVVPDKALLEALGRWSHGRARDASGDLFEQGRVAEQERELAQLRGKPTVDGKVPGVRADMSSPAVYLEGSSVQRVGGVAAGLPIAGLEPPCALVEVTFESRPVCEQALDTVKVPVVARVDLLDRLCLDGVERLSPRGMEAAGDRVIAAANELAVKLLARAREPGAAHTLFGDPRALRLVDALLSLPQRDPRIDDGLRGNVLRWPTIQGDGRLFGELRLVDGELWVGALGYASWVAAPAPAPADLDRPILHVPQTLEGALLAGILQRLGLKLRVVTDAVAALQAKRAHGAGDRPRLAARPPHPALACDLHQLKIEGVEGEVAIFESGEALVELSSLDGDTRRIPLDLSFPARGVARMDVLTSSSVPIVTQKLTRAAVRFLVSLVPSLGELPSYVRGHLRILVCRAVQQDRQVPAQARTAPIFQDVDGAWWTLDDLQSSAHGDWSCTFDPPPYSRARQDGHTLRLTPTEHLLLHEKVKILNVTEWMRRDLEAERRRDAPQVAEVRFDAVAREHLVSSFVVSAGSMEGEIGVLHPSADAARGVQVFSARRPVCLVHDAPGWPLAAVINDDALRINRWWTELLPADEIALRARVRALAVEHMRATLAAEVPKDALASVFLNEALPPVAAYGSTEPMTVTGYLFLPARWPVTPSVRLFVQRVEQPARSPVSISMAAILPTLPIGGVIFLSHAAQVMTAGAASRAGLALRDVAARVLAPLVQKNTEDPEIRTYQWNLRLLGSTAAGEPSAIAADGRPITADEVIAALHDRKEIWLTDRQGSIEGDFPEDAAPPFVLLDDGSPLVRVLRARLPAEKVRWLGATAPRKSLAPSAADALAPPSVRPLVAPPLRAVDTAEPQEPPSRSWLADLIGRVRGFLANAPLPPDRATGIGDAVERTLRALRLRDEPVIVVHEVTRGRLVRYDQGRRVVSINVDHPALAPHLAAPSPTALRRVCLALVAAALSEINIALEHVTDHDEEQALLELLRQEAAASAAPAPDAG